MFALRIPCEINQWQLMLFFVIILPYDLIILLGFLNAWNRGIGIWCGSFNLRIILAYIEYKKVCCKLWRISWLWICLLIVEASLFWSVFFFFFSFQVFKFFSTPNILLLGRHVMLSASDLFLLGGLIGRISFHFFPSAVECH